MKNVKLSGKIFLGIAVIGIIASTSAFAQRPSAAKLFGKFDNNKDGALVQDEVPALMWEHLSAADADEDGSVTEAEFEVATAEKDGKLE